MLDTSDLDPVVHVIQASLTPIFLLTAVAGLLGVFTTRLARISDLVKSLSEVVGANQVGDQVLRRRLGYLQRRSHALEIAVILASIAGACTCGTVLALFLALLRSRATGAVLFFLFGVAVVCTIGALGAFLAEVLYATRGIRVDVAHKFERLDRSYLP